MFAKSWLVESMSVKRKSWSFHSKQETIRGFFTPSRRCDLQIERWACERSVHVPLYQWAFRGTDTNPPADCQFLCHKQFIWSFPRRSQIAWSVETCWKPHHWHLTLAPSSEAEVQCQLQLQQLETCDLCLCWTWFAPWSKFRRSLESKCGTSMNFHELPACFKFHQRHESQTSWITQSSPLSSRCLQRNATLKDPWSSIRSYWLVWLELFAWSICCSVTSSVIRVEPGRSMKINGPAFSRTQWWHGDIKSLGTATSGCFEVKHGKTNQHELRNRPFQCSKTIQFVSKDLHKNSEWRSRSFYRMTKAPKKVPFSFEKTEMAHFSW